jgi:hypothetical protein
MGLRRTETHEDTQRCGVGFLAYTSPAERIAQRAAPAPVGQEAYSTKAS